jgi:hypothetical protein
MTAVIVLLICAAFAWLLDALQLATAVNLDATGKMLVALAAIAWVLS